MRYYLPGALFLAYLLSFIVLSLPLDTIKSIEWIEILGVLLGALGASPVVGYLIYAFYNEFIYELLARWATIRHALEYLEALGFDKEKSFLQKKEFIDLVYHSALAGTGKDTLKIDPEILKTLKGHLSNFATRVTCGALVPILLIPAMFITVMTLQDVFAVSLIFRPLVILYMLGIVVLSTVLLLGCMRVLREAYQLEEYFLKAKKKEIEELLRRLSASP